MTGRRKDLGKRKGGLKQRFLNWAAGTKPPGIQDATINNIVNDGVVRGMSGWNNSYNETPLSGDLYVGGKCCKTPGEYKAACAKFYGT